MTKRSRAQRDRGVGSMHETVELAADYVADLTDCKPIRVTALEPTDEGGWIVEVEVVTDRRIPSSADMLTLYKIELDADGEVLAHHRIGRYSRYQRLSSAAVNGHADDVGFEYAGRTD